LSFARALSCSLLLTLAAGLTLPAAPGAVQPRTPAPSADRRMAWWRDARFGLFIHWGLYSVTEGEWGGKTGYGEWVLSSAKIPLPEYEGLKAAFNPVKFDADAWVKLARDAGFKYIVITTKHHDGFALFDSRLTDWCVRTSPFKRDIMKELAEACRKQGMRLGWYHSIMDWHHPDYLPRRAWDTRPTDGAEYGRYVDFMKGQLKELLTNYGPISLLWFDGQWEGTWTHAMGQDLYKYVRSLQPDLIVNNRVDIGGGEFQMSKDESYAGDYGTPEQEIPPMGLAADWETCMTMNDHWGYNKADQNWKGSDDLIRKLVDIASKGGNFLLNVGPTPEGLIPEPSVERLKDMGAWLKVNGESIHGTSASPFPGLPFGRCTRKAIKGGTRLYFHVFDWPKDGVLRIPGLYGTPRRAFLLSDGDRRSLKAAEAKGEMRVSVPLQAPDAVDSVVVLDLAGRPDVALPPSIQAGASIFTESTTALVSTGRDRVTLHATLDGTEPSWRSPACGGSLRLRESCTVKVQAFRGREAVSPVSQATFTKVRPRPATPTLDLQPGLRFSYFEGDFDRCDALKSPLKSGLAEDFSLEARGRNERFGFRFKGYVEVVRDGVYTFFTTSDDGSRLFIDGERVVDNDKPHGPEEQHGVIALAKGFHRIQVDYFQGTGGHELKVHWSGPEAPRQPIGAADLKH